MEPTNTAELSALSSLRIAVFGLGEHRSLSLKSGEPDWLLDSFGEAWDRSSGNLILQPFSALESFVADVAERSENGCSVGHESMIFEESSLATGSFSGVVSVIESGNGRPSLRFAIRPSDLLDETNRIEIQTLRDQALAETGFGDAIHRRKSAISANKSEGLPANLLPLILSSIRDAFVILDSAGHCTLANEEAGKLFPNLNTNSGDTPVWEHFSAILGAHDQIAELRTQIQEGLRESLETKVQFSFPVRHERKLRITPFSNADDEGNSIWQFAALGQHSGNEDGNFLSSISESERLELVGRLAGGIAHDFNNLLAIVMGNLSLLSDTAESAGYSDICETAELASQAAEKAAVLVRQLLGFSRKSRLERQVIAINDLIEETTSLFVSTVSDSLRITLDLDTQNWKIYGDPDKLNQVLLNLLENAGQAMEESGDITIKAQTYILEDEAMANAMECEQGHYLVITVRDNGPGMPNEVCEKVFEPFFTTKEPGKGTGLGLANAMGILRQHGGHISCTSILNEGTAFTLYLPRERNLSREDKTTLNASQRERNLNRMATQSDDPAVLVIDDEAMLRNVVRTMLQKNGYRTLGASNGREGLEVIHEHLDEIAIIILDLAMPEMTGNEFLKRITELNIDVPVIVASGYLIDTDKFIRETGSQPAAFFSKPYQLAELLEKVREQNGGNEASKPSGNLALPA